MGTNFRQNADGSASLVDDNQGEVSRFGGGGTQNYKDVNVVKIPLAITAGGGGSFSWALPAGTAALINNVVLDITTGVAQTISVGVAANATTSSATLIDTLTLTTGVYDNITNKGAGGNSVRKITSSQFVTGTVSATATGLVGNAYISYIPI